MAETITDLGPIYEDCVCGRPKLCKRTYEKMMDAYEARITALENADKLVKLAIHLFRDGEPITVRTFAWDEWITAAQLCGYDAGGWEPDPDTVGVARKLLEGK